MSEHESAVKGRINEDLKAAMRARERERIGTLRFILSAIKQREIDEQSSLGDEQVLAVLDKLAKQRRESIEQYRQAGREDLAGREEQELQIIQDYLPTPLDEAELDQLIAAAVAETGAASPRDMGKVMALLKPKVQGRADMSQVSARVKQRLAG